MKGLVFLTLFIVVGCATPLPLPKDQSFQKKILLPFRVEDIIINDLRADTTSVKMELPVFVAKEREWRKSPALSPELKTTIKAMIASSSNAEGLPANVTLSIKEGFYRIYGNAMTVGEYTFFECKINYTLKSTGQSWAVASNSYTDQSGVFNATEKHAGEVYKITVRNAVFKALKESEKIFEE